MHERITDGTKQGIVIDLNFGNGDRDVQWLEEVGSSDWRVNRSWVKRTDLMWMPCLSAMLEMIESHDVEPHLTVWDKYDDGTVLYEC